MGGWVRCGPRGGVDDAEQKCDQPFVPTTISGKRNHHPLTHVHFALPPAARTEAIWFMTAHVLQLGLGAAKVSVVCCGCGCVRRRNIERTMRCPSEQRTPNPAVPMDKPDVRTWWRRTLALSPPGARPPVCVVALCWLPPASITRVFVLAAARKLSSNQGRPLCQNAGVPLRVW